mmetsp:Transcript_7622/g.12633  ORF Transcript_7622/g.12633 Transcript_7622/m.12633 type:complete len:217 (-) Transcript_7622:1333-1983(-)
MGRSLGSPCQRCPLCWRAFCNNFVRRSHGPCRRRALLHQRVSFIFLHRVYRQDIREWWERDGDSHVDLFGDVSVPETSDACPSLGFAAAAAWWREAARIDPTVDGCAGKAECHRYCDDAVTGGHRPCLRRRSSQSIVAGDERFLCRGGHRDASRWVLLFRYGTTYQSDCEQVFAGMAPSRSFARNQGTRFEDGPTADRCYNSDISVYHPIQPFFSR